MIGKNAIPRYKQEKQQLQDLVDKMKQPEFKDIKWIQEQIKFYKKRIKRIDELIKQRLEWDSCPMIIVLKENQHNNPNVRIL